MGLEGLIDITSACAGNELGVMISNEHISPITSINFTKHKKFIPNSQLIHLTELMLLTLARRRVLGHKVPCLRHLYQPIKSKINQYSNNSQKKINTNYSKNYIILLKLQQITSTNHLDRFIYIPSSWDIKIMLVLAQMPKSIRLHDSLHGRE